MDVTMNRSDAARTRVEHQPYEEDVSSLSLIESGEKWLDAVVAQLERDRSTH